MSSPIFTWIPGFTGVISPLTEQTETGSFHFIWFCGLRANRAFFFLCLKAEQDPCPHSWGRSEQRGLYSLPLARSRLVWLGTGTAAPNSPFCNASRVPRSGISLSWSCWEGTQTSLQYNGWLQQSAPLLPGHYMNPTQLFTLFHIFPIKVQIAFLLIYPSLFLYCSC